MRSVASCGGKLAVLMCLLPFLPYRLLAAAHLGFFARVRLHAAVQDVLPRGTSWNMLVGTYDAKQKLVVQAFPADGVDCRFIKIGNDATERQMTAEKRFRSSPPRFRRVQVPELLAAAYRAEGVPFNIQVTREFRGSKVPAALTEDIVVVYREIAGEPQLVDGQLCEFSHGDFVPWNLRRTDRGGNIVFDWEHCGMKPCGYDLAYFGVVMRLACQGMSFDEAFAASMTDLRRFVPDLEMEKETFYRLFTSVITPDGF